MAAARRPSGDQLKKKNDTEQLSLAGTDEGEILGRLNERVERAIAMIQELRKERNELRASLERAERTIREQEAASGKLVDLESEYDRFRGERSEIRQRIESILSSLEGLDESDEP
jgi:FtsZ-binding cell division protein ZapB